MMLSRDEVLRKARALPSSPIAIEAFWDGDTHGWFVVLVALLNGSEGQIVEHELATLSGGGDIRLFNAQVPPWPEAILAKSVGEEVADTFAVPFWFPSPDHPEDQCPRFWEKEQGTPCARCGMPLLQKRECPWKGLCYRCHLAPERR